MARSGHGTGCYGPKTRIFHAFWALAGPRGVPVELPFGAKAVQFVLFTSAETEAAQAHFRFSLACCGGDRCIVSSALET
ncbi:AAR_G0032710.mRNA.1.CDS.1 [Saccharomyces cerevisiae]|nr:BDH_1b_G0032660.mRNA.1.CDS.1 [Saccharomyces cerevisiae]CAI4586918.1 AAR_G0032710.mRNA.1.CDS.1 [Saccharomyces cerevisiae]CAI5015605.1 BTE_HP_G0070680.mRNA.1.CDS.1 [Saccharomyces cerevisiae]CAI5080417.1 BTE_HP_G0102180.mRNA.1.CDS.1 [Saccharomyces cerevisiae]CAI5187030.1 BTE_HP_G0137570.mRNA.1.CDS.1 [Saccharomyces cerevisiae]